MINLPTPLKKLKDRSQFFLRYLFVDIDEDLIKKFKDIHTGDRCFIVGTGPSLNKTNLSLLKNEIVFGVNTLYKTGLPCKYYAVSDLFVFENHKEPIFNLDTTLFLSGEVARNYFPLDHEAVLLRTNGYMSVKKEFPKDISKYVVGGHTVVIDICLQVAYYMGFKEVYLLGTDFSNLGVRFDGSVTENLKTVGLKDVDKVFTCFEICKKAYEGDGRHIYNCTPGGNLEVFERKKLEDICQ